MVSLFVLSLALSTAGSIPHDSAATLNSSEVASSALLQMQSGSPDALADEGAPQIDNMAIHPDASVCYKIRAYIFTKGRNPKLLRETTCGPKAATSRQTDGNGLAPLEERTKPAPQE